MIYLILAGRLGNQLFQYAFARKIKHMTGQNIVIDFTAVNNVNKNDWQDYLKYFNTDYEIVSKTEYYPIQRFLYRTLKYIRPKKSEMRQYIFDKAVADLLGKFGVLYFESTYKTYKYEKILSKNIVIRGWFESEEYFEEIRNILLKEFTLKEKLSSDNQNVYNYLKSSESVCLTIRRGNFLSGDNKSKYYICDIDYFLNGIRHIRSIYPNSVIYVCSDDIEWCKRELGFLDNLIYECNNPVPIKLILMSACRHFVISNSTFSWWAQYLSDNSNKIVVAPKIWRNTELPPENIFCRDWVYLD